MKDKMNKISSSVKISISEILKSFFTSKQAEQFYLYNRKNLQLDSEVNGQLKNQTVTNEYLNRTQIDFLVTFAEENISAENYLNLLLYLSKYVTLNGEFTLAERLLELVVKYCHNKSLFNNFKANALLGLSEVHSRQANWYKSFSTATQANKIFTSEKDLKGVVKCENLIGTNYGDRGNLKKAVKHFEKCINLLEGQTDLELRGRIEINLGIINNILGKFDIALANFNRALISYQRLQNHHRIAEVRHNLGMTCYKKGELEEAIAEFDQSIALSIKVNYAQLLGISYIGKAFVYIALDDIVMADSFSNKAMELSLKLNDMLSIAEVYRLKGLIQKKLQNFVLAKSYLLTSLRMNRELQNKMNEAETLSELGILANENKNAAEAKNYFDKALLYFQSIKADHEVSKITMRLSECH